MKVAAGWYRERRGAALGMLIGALTVGSAFPHLLAAASAAIPWRVLMLTASALAVVGGALVKLFVRDGPYLQSSARFDPAAVGRVFTHRPTRLATLGYLGHMWELYAVWTWIAAYASASLGLGQRGGACLGRGFGRRVHNDRQRRDRVRCRRLVRGPNRQGADCAVGDDDERVCCAIAGLVFGAPLPILVLFATVWGVAVVADSAQLSALVAEHSPLDHVGTALTVQLCAGFLLTMVSIWLVPAVAEILGWKWVFLCLMPGPVAGTLAVRRLMLETATVGPAMAPRLG